MSRQQSHRPCDASQRRTATPEQAERVIQHGTQLPVSVTGGSGMATLPDSPSETYLGGRKYTHYHSQPLFV